MSASRAAVASAALLIFILGASSEAGAQNDDAADTAFWQSIQADNDPAEYKLYLEQFPTGRYASLAQHRLAGSATPTAGPRPAPAAAPVQKGAPLPGEPDDDGPPPPPERIEVTPARARVGEIISFGCIDFPNPTTYDKIVVVPAGSPVMDPTRAQDDTKIIFWEYAVNCKQRPAKGGPFAPGRYEARFMTQLYNNDHLYEQKAMTPFTVR